MSKSRVAPERLALIDIALDTKDFEWAKEIYSKKIDEEKVKEGMSVELKDLYNSFSSIDLTFSYVGDEANEYINLHDKISKQMEVSINKESHSLIFVGTLNDILVKDKQIKISVSYNDKQSLNGIYSFLHERCKVNFNLMTE